MQTRSNTPLLPGYVSVDILAAVEMALAKFPSPRVSEVARDVLPNPVSGVIRRIKSAKSESLTKKRKRVKRELLDAGVTVYGLLKSESRYLPRVIHDNEHIEAVIYGQHNSSSAMLVATDERIIYLDKKPIAEMFDEVSYDVVSGVGFDIHMFFATVVLHTPVRNYNFRLVNLHCAEKFARHIEKLRIDNDQAEKTTDTTVREVSTNTQPQPEEDMSGYLLLPMDEEERRKVQLGP